MIIKTWGEMLSGSFQNLLSGIATFIPSLILSLLIITIGWAIGVLFYIAIDKFFKAIKFDDALRRSGFDEFVKRGGINLNSGKFIGKIVQYFVMIVFLVAAFDMLGLGQVTTFLQQIVYGYLPQLIVAVLMLLVGVVIGDVVGRIVSVSSSSAGITSSGFLGAITRWGVWVFSLLVALTQMGIAASFIQTLFTGFVVAVSLALGLSFGLGGQEPAKKMIERIQEEMKSGKH